MNPEIIVNLKLHPIQDAGYNISCKAQLERSGALVMEDFLTSETVDFLQIEACELRPQAYF